LKKEEKFLEHKRKRERERAYYYSKTNKPLRQALKKPPQTKMQANDVIICRGFKGTEI
jgi:hypothetical protein